MIPRIIHYCWFGRGPMPELALKCIESWHKFMPDWEYKLWNEDNFDVNSVPYVKEAYEAGKFAFVSDYVRIHALVEYGGIYLDTDVMALRSFEPLLGNHAFAGFEGSKHIPVGTCVMGSQVGGCWFSDLLELYSKRHFVDSEGRYDLTTNVAMITEELKGNGLLCNGEEQDVAGVHIYPVDFFSPRLTTGEYIVTANTYSDHLGICSWKDLHSVPFWYRILGTRNRIRLIKLKRKILG